LPPRENFAESALISYTVHSISQNLKNLKTFRNFTCENEAYFQPGDSPHLEILHHRYCSLFTKALTKSLKNQFAPVQNKSRVEIRLPPFSFVRFEHNIGRIIKLLENIVFNQWIRVVNIRSVVTSRSKANVLERETG